MFTIKFYLFALYELIINIKHFHSLHVRSYAQHFFGEALADFLNIFQINIFLRNGKNR